MESSAQLCGWLPNSGPPAPKALQSSVNLRGSLPRVTWAQFISFPGGLRTLSSSFRESLVEAWPAGLPGEPAPGSSPAHPDLPAGAGLAMSICMSSLAHLLYFTVALLMWSSPAREASSWGLVNASLFLKAQLRSHRLRCQPDRLNHSTAWISSAPSTHSSRGPPDTRGLYLSSVLRCELPKARHHNEPQVSGSSI